MIKSNNGSKTEFMVESQQFWAIESGFLVVELLISIVIGLVFISALMRMQIILCQLTETFDMRERALVLAVNLREQGACSQYKQKSFSVRSGQREFTLNLDEQKVKVEWRSITGETYSLVL